MRVPSHTEHPSGNTTSCIHDPLPGDAVELAMPQWAETLTVMRGKLGSLPASSRMCAGAGGTMKGPRGLPGPTLSM